MRTRVREVTLSFSMSASVVSLMATSTPTTIIATSRTSVTAPTTHLRLLQQRRLVAGGVDRPPCNNITTLY